MSEDEKVSLVADIKNSLDVTWDDPATDKKYREMTASGIRYLDDKLGPGVDYTQEGSDGRTLLFEYVRYLRDGALDVFENNYRPLILAAQTRRRLTEYAETPVSGGE